MFSFTFVVLLIASTSAAVVEIEVDSVTAKTTTSPTFLAQGWEPYAAIATMAQSSDDKVLQRVISAFRGSTIRFGGISADWLNYTVDDTPTPACKYSTQKPFAPGSMPCAFSTGALKRLLGFMNKAGVNIIFDLN